MTASRVTSEMLNKLTMSKTRSMCSWASSFLFPEKIRIDVQGITVTFSECNKPFKLLGDPSGRVKSLEGFQRTCLLRTVVLHEDFTFVALRYRYARIELTTLDLICPSTYQLLQNSSGDSGLDLSFNKSASPKSLFSLARVSLVEASKLDLSFIDPTVTLFRVFQTLCKKGDWFSFAKRRALSPRHPDTAIDDPRPAAGSFNMADVRRLSAHVIKLRDMPEGVLVLSGLSRVCKSRVCNLVLRGANDNVMASTDVVIPNPTLEDLVVSTPSSKIVAKAEASQKRKASTSGAALSHVAKHTRSALAQSSGSTSWPNLFVGDSDDESDGDDDACVEILLVTHFCSAAVIPSLGNQDSQGKGIMVDDVAAPSGGASRPRPSFGPAPSFRYVSGNAIHMDFFPFSAGPYYATYPEDVLTKEVFKDPAVCKTIVDQFPTSGEMVRVESLSGDQLTAKMSVLHCMMMSHGGELLARYHGLNQSHYKYVLSKNSRLKNYEEKVANLTSLELQVVALKKQVSGLNDKLISSDASFTKSMAKGKERKNKIKSLSKSLDNLHAEVARLSATLNQATILEAERDEEILWLNVGFEHGLSMHQTKDKFAAVLKKMVNFMPGAQDRLDEASLLLEPEKLVRSANVPIPKDTRVSPPIAKESTVTPVSKSLELSAIVNFTAFVVAFEHNEEMGISVALDDVAELVAVVLERVSSGPDDVVVSLSAHEKGDGLDSSSAIGEEKITFIQSKIQNLPESYPDEVRIENRG
ncbi:hypothetical protein Tco_0786312 [Tanacetum coccineum]